MEDKAVTQKIKSFYEKTPFPNYSSIDSLWRLRQKASEAIFPKLLDDQIPKDAKILEVGCGTGQLSNLLGSSWKRQVIGADMCLNSLKLAKEFKKKMKIKNVEFQEMNLFKPIFKPNTFDYIICNGVLHHTGNPFGGFQSISKLIRPGGYIVIGLYNKYGRIPTDLRRIIFKITGNNFKSLDPYIKSKKLEKVKEDTWFADQYLNPHESKHTIDEVLSWFDKCGFEFINAIPKTSLSSSFKEDEKLFSKSPIGSKLDHFLVQLGMLLAGGSEGGFFTMIGRKI